MYWKCPECKIEMKKYWIFSITIIYKTHVIYWTCTYHPHFGKFHGFTILYPFKITPVKVRKTDWHHFTWLLKRKKKKKKMSSNMSWMSKFPKDHSDNSFWVNLKCLCAMNHHEKNQSFHWARKRNNFAGRKWIIQFNTN